MLPSGAVTVSAVSVVTVTTVSPELLMMLPVGVLAAIGISVRDKPELLRQYLPAFDPSFIGLYGDAQATQKVTSDFKVYAQDGKIVEALGYAKRP